MLLGKSVLAHFHPEYYGRILSSELGFTWRQAKKRKFSVTICCKKSVGPLKLKTSHSNLQKSKHVKYTDEFVSKQINRYKLSKRRLANMMGEDPDTYTEDDVKRSIRYLFPSDLDEDSRPSMDYPSKVFTSRIRSHWDDDRRPFHYLYYTKRPYANQLLHDTYQHILDGRKVDTTNEGKRELNLQNTRWMNMQELSTEILQHEALNGILYKQIIAQLERLLEEENSYLAEDFIMKHRREIPSISMMDDIKEAQTMEDGRKFIEEKGQKKTAIAKVKLIHPGTGIVTVNGREFHKHFNFLEDRQTVLSPFMFLHQLARYDVEATTDGGIRPSKLSRTQRIASNPMIRLSSQAVAIRIAIARALRSFVTAVEVEMMRRAGLLTFDKRWKERKVFGQHKARKKHTWKRR